MNSSFQKKFAEIEKTKARLFDMIEGLSEAEIDKKPAENEWSISQVIQHLTGSESLSNGYITKKMTDYQDVNPYWLKSKIAYYKLVYAFDFTKQKFKSPAFIDLDENKTKATLLKDWSDSRALLAEILGKVPEKYVHSSLFKHPRVGKMTLIDMMSFFNIHIHRHLTQIQKIKHQLQLK
jgi:DinB superfamily